jgi:hypothetical protein
VKRLRNVGHVRHSPFSQTRRRECDAETLLLHPISGDVLPLPFYEVDQRFMVQGRLFGADGRGFGGGGDQNGGLKVLL